MRETNNHTERILLKDVSHGDMNAFSILFKSYYPKLKRFLTGFLDNEVDAEDLTQDVFVKLWQSREALTNVENINAYLYHSAKNTLYTHIANTKKTAVLSTTSLPEVATVDDLNEILFAKELEEIIDLTIEKMPSQRKKIFILSRKEGVSNKDIASRLNISKRTVEAHISAALIDIREKLKLVIFLFF